MMRRPRLLPVFLLLFSLPGLAAPGKAAPPKASSRSKASPAAPGTSGAFLPEDFAEWHVSAPPVVSASPEAADSANVDVLKEYGFQQFESAVYTNADAKLKLRAIRFQDASGAYGAFTYYRRPGSLAEEIGRSAAWDGSHALFWTGATLVDATFDHLTAMSAAELRELAGDLPQLSGSASVAPPLAGYLPRADLDTGSAHYALGPVSYARAGGVLPPSLIGFGATSAEAITAAYNSSNGSGTLTLIDYPTPQLAAARLADIDGFLKAGNTPQAAWPQPLADSHPDALLTRRSGPIIAVTSGSFPAAAARALLDKINYQADITWNNPNGYVGEGAKVARLLLGVFALFGILGGSAVLLGIFLGGGRAIIRRLRGKPASALDEETEFIRLKLNE
jgi:hypothetical protein